MNLEQISKLNFIKGMLEGLAYGVDNENICDGIMKCSEAIDRLLAEESSRPVFKPEPETAVERCCKTCKHESLLPDVFPCSDCWFGDGSDDRIVYWGKKEDSDDVCSR